LLNTFALAIIMKHACGRPRRDRGGDSLPTTPAEVPMTPYQKRLSPFIRRMAEDMQLRNFSANTIDAYTFHVD
jgi:hypothetical protein